MIFRPLQSKSFGVVTQQQNHLDLWMLIEVPDYLLGVAAVSGGKNGYACRAHVSNCRQRKQRIYGLNKCHAGNSHEHDHLAQRAEFIEVHFGISANEPPHQNEQGNEKEE